jgi:hypothetical protein
VRDERHVPVEEGLQRAVKEAVRLAEIKIEKAFLVTDPLKS